jgi:uncharacterized damage-inducible protein DinB
MTPARTLPALTLEEILNWSDESAQRWFQFFAATPDALAVPCGVYKSDSTALGLVRHVVVVEMRYAQRLANLPVTDYETVPSDSLDALIALHNDAVAQFRTLLADTAQDWETQMEFVTLTAGTLHASRRKVLAHTLLHGIRHWAQLATLCRAAGHATSFHGDIMASSALR